MFYHTGRVKLYFTYHCDTLIYDDVVYLLHIVEATNFPAQCKCCGMLDTNRLHHK